MVRYILTRLLQLPLLLFAVSLLVFVVLRLGPASPVDLATETVRDAAEIEKIRHAWGLDRPILVQYGDYIVHVLQGDFGRSFFSNTPVVDVIRERLPATLELAFLGILLGCGLGVTLGIIAAIGADTPIDTLARIGALAGISIPSFWLGLMFISLFAVNLGWLPVAGRFDARRPFDEITGFYVLDGILKGQLEVSGIALKYMLMPAIVNALFVAGFVVRITRASMLEALKHDYIRTARAKGLKNHVVIIRHALRNALLPIITIIALQFGLLLAGSAVIETIFAYPGLGKLMIDAIYLHDYPQVQASVLLLATIYIIVNLVVDVLYGFVDPRVRRAHN